MMNKITKANKNADEIKIGELDKSIIELSKRKLKLLQEVNDINESISFLRQQQEQLINV